MDPEVIQKGKSHCGVGFICKKKNQISYRSFDVNSNRVCAVQLLSSQSVVLTIIEVYKTLGILHDIVDAYGDGA